MIEVVARVNVHGIKLGQTAIVDETNEFWQGMLEHGYIVKTADVKGHSKGIFAEPAKKDKTRPSESPSFLEALGEPVPVEVELEDGAGGDDPGEAAGEPA